MGDAIAKTRIEPATERYAMRCAVDLARRAAGLTAPNPMVGCVLVQVPGIIVGRGWHLGPGTDHAEIMALKEAGDAARGAVAYVTLEPCNHTGRTGPCAEALIEAGIREVVYAIADPNPAAAGGAARLREAGVAVRSGLCEEEALALTRAWRHALAERRPYVVGKTAMSIDGRIATASGESQWITSSFSRNAGHRIRWETDAIIVGAGTVIADDPALTARPADVATGKQVIDGERYPLRVVLDSTGRCPPGARVFGRIDENGAKDPAILAATTGAPRARLDAFREHGVEVLVLPANDSGRVDLHALLEALYERDIHHAMVEGGGEVLGAFFDADLLEEITFFIAPRIIGGGKPALGGGGVARLADADRFDFKSAEDNGPDLIWTGVRRERT
ncbi:MAG: bifunctional diaminohydroxyphosphoribosylaminopyrimidine deaminase/5-amino-6-(5-phosphoribosylamino)uracil reductase RibD [Woeseia sp.]